VYDTLIYSSGTEIKVNPQWGGEVRLSVCLTPETTPRIQIKFGNGIYIKITGYFNFGPYRSYTDSTLHKSKMNFFFQFSQRDLVI
jgi:hypothetical protein